MTRSGIRDRVGALPTGPTDAWDAGNRVQGATRGFPQAGLSAGWMEVLFTEMGLVGAFQQEGQTLKDKVPLYCWGTAEHQVRSGCFR